MLKNKIKISYSTVMQTLTKTLLSTYRKLMKHDFYSISCAFFWLFAGHSSAQELMIVTEHSPPYQILNKDNQVEGFSTEVIRAALAITPYKYQIQIYPWSRAFVMAKEKSNTCIYLISNNTERAKFFQWVAPIVPTNDYFISLSNRTDINISNIEDIKNYKVAVLKDDRTHQMMLKLGFEENKNLYIINNTYSMLKLLMTRDNIDFILADTVNVKYRAKFNNIDPKLFKTYFKLNKTPVNLNFACSLSTPVKTVNTLKAAINTIKKDGTYQKIAQKWQIQ